MSKISKGPKKNIGQTWHHQLADKTAGVKTHFFWAMKNSNGKEDTLRFYFRINQNQATVSLTIRRS